MPEDKKKKKVGERWKAKPIISTKNISLEQKKETVDVLMEKIPEVEKEGERKWPGQPVKMTEKMLQKLDLCFSVAMTDEQACFHCGISTSTLYNYQHNHPEYLERKDILKQSITMQARVNVWKIIKKWWEASSWKRLEKMDKLIGSKPESNVSNPLKARLSQIKNQNAV